MFQSDDSEADREVGQGRETRSKRTAGNQSFLFSHSHSHEGVNQGTAQREGTAGGNRDKGHIRYVFIF